MRPYIRNKRIVILPLMLLILGAGLYVGADRFMASSLPDMKELTFVECSFKAGTVYEYTGKEIVPEIDSIAFQDKEGKKILVSGDDIAGVECNNNVKAGTGDMTVSLKNYQGDCFMEDCFQIIPQKAKDLSVTEATKEQITLSWTESPDVDGYRISRSLDDGENFSAVQYVKADEELIYHDTDLEFNQKYLYQIECCVIRKREVICSEPSDTVEQQTPLATPSIAKAINQTYNTNLLSWAAVDGAVGYQVFRSIEKNGPFEMLKEVPGDCFSYIDSTCECGKTYYYYITACQQVGEEKVFGEPSGVVSVLVKPNTVQIAGTTVSDSTGVSISWKKADGAGGYEVFRSENKSSEYKLVASFNSPDTLTFSETGLEKGKIYSYKVRSFFVVNGANIYGNFSNIYNKQAVYIYTGPVVSGDISFLNQFVGCPYVPGGSSPSGWDCSGFTRYVFSKYYGISLGQSAAVQAGGGASVSLNDRSSWQPGDLLFYKSGGRISHVAIYMGNGQLIHALGTKHGTIIQGVDYYEKWDTSNSLALVKRYF